MSLEIYWKKALEQTRLSIDDESLYPLLFNKSGIGKNLTR